MDGEEWLDLIGIMKSEHCSAQSKHDTESFPDETRSQFPQAGTQNVAQNSDAEVIAERSDEV